MANIETEGKNYEGLTGAGIGGLVGAGVAGPLGAAVGAIAGAFLGPKYLKGVVAKATEKIGDFTGKR